jgi:hypothetical protein
MVIVAFASPFWEQQGIPFEFRLLGAWAVLGVLTWHFWVGRAERA